jgi:hypothetical protein
MANPDHHAEPLLEKPVRPPGRFFKGDPVARQYAAKRNAWMRQQARLHPKPKKPAPTDPVEIFAVRVKRLMKAENARAVAHRNAELDEFLAQITRKLPPEEIRALVTQLRAGRDRHQEQAAEIMRVAEAPAKIEQMEGEQGGPLLGEWTSCMAVDAERVGSGGYVEPMDWHEREEIPRRRDLVNEVSSARRDTVHWLLGHGLEAGALPRDGQEFYDSKDADVRTWADKRQRQLAQKFDEIRESGRVPSASEIDEMAGWREELDKTTRQRARLVISGPRKGLPYTDEMGVIRAPGAIPDIGQKTANALLGRPIGVHFAKPTPARLRREADRHRAAADAYERGACYLEALSRRAAAD